MSKKEDWAEFPHGEITGIVIRCAMNVHYALGNGFQEYIYQRALGIELRRMGIAFSREQRIPVYFKGERVGTHRIDFLVEEVIVVEIKAAASIENSFITQTKNYLKAHNLEVGLLINFGAASLQFRRLTNTNPKS